MQIARVTRSWSIISFASLSLVNPTPNVVEGTVRTVDGRPVPGATIRIAGATGAGRGTTREATSNANGHYRIVVPLGHYNVDAFADVEYEGQTYEEIWLDRGDAPCGRVMSDKGIVRHFTLRLSGPKRCMNGLSPNNPNAYNGAYITALTSNFPDDAVITFNLTPLGPLADGSNGKPLRITRTGAALKKGGGPINETSFLHDIPLGRYRIAAQVRYADGATRGTTLELRDGGNTSGATLDITFHANMLGGGIRPVGLGVIPAAAAPAADASADAPRDTPEATPLPAEAIPPAPAPQTLAELPIGRYACSYRSQYAGDIPTDKSVTIIAGGRYHAYGAAGTYTLDPGTGNVTWTGPLGAADVRATFGKRNGQPAITVVGGGASEDPDRTNYCVLIDA